MGGRRELFTIDDLLSWTGGTLEAPLQRASAPVASVEVDSRHCTQGSLFVALPGERTDGHRHIGDAKRRGAVAVLVQEGVDGDEAEGLAVVRVDNSLAALQKAARGFLQRFPDVIRIGVTGSNGKTTTKEMLYAILREEMRAYATPGNLNSDCGLPLAVFRMPRECEIAVFEMAMNRPGEIEELAEICRPDIAVITNIGTAHIGMLGSTDRIAAEKKQITSRFTGNEVLFIPDEDAYASFLEEGVNGEIVRYGYGISNAAYRNHGDGSELRLPDLVLRLPLPGRFNGSNALAAVAVARRLSVSAAAIQRGLAHVSLPEGRSNVLDGKRLVFNDTYNANPQSMVAALDAFDALVRERRVQDTVIVIGEMGELGDHSPASHAQVVVRALESRPALLVLVGPAFEEFADAGDDDTRVLWSATAESVRSLLSEHLHSDQAVFLKGSRAVGLETLIDIAAGTTAAGEAPHA